MRKRYTVTFDSKLSSFDKPLKQVQDLGVDVQSAQRFIGTAVVEASTAQVKKMKQVDGVSGVTETGMISAM